MVTHVTCVNFLSNIKLMCVMIPVQYIAEMIFML